MSKVNNQNLLFESKAISRTNDKKLKLFYPLNDDHVSLPFLIRLHQLALVLGGDGVLLASSWTLVVVTHHHPAQQELLAIQL